MISGAVDEITFGLADRVSAGAQTVFQGGLDDWDRRYREEMDEERRRDAYDAEHHGRARLAGQVAGTVGSFFIPGGALVRGAKLLSTAARFAGRGNQAMDAIGLAGRALTRARAAQASTRPARLAGAAGVTNAERAAWLLGPGALNAGVEWAGNEISGRPTTLEDAAGAFAGGVLAGRMRGLGPASSAALSAAATSAYQDRFNHRDVSAERATMAGLLGGAFGHLGERAGLQWASKPTTRKGWGGQVLGMGRMAINGHVPKLYPKPRFWAPPSKRVPGTPFRPRLDGQSGRRWFEFKLGESPSLTTPQKAARDYYGDNFVLYHFLPEEVGQLSGLASGLASPSTFEEFYE